MTEYPWYGTEASDPAQLLVHLTGVETHDTQKLPSFVQSLVLGRFSERYE